jgi:hypothetical protein
MSAIAWKTKKTAIQKKENRHHRAVRRLLVCPERRDFKSTVDIVTYCHRRGLSKHATDRVIGLINGTIHAFDTRDQRTLPACERVPRTLECPPSPPRFWEIDYMPCVKQMPIQKSGTPEPHPELSDIKLCKKGFRKAVSRV